jgi:hypothetical protein
VALTAAQWTAYRTNALALGYTAAEWDAQFPLDKSNYVLRDVVLFLHRFAIDPRWDVTTQQIVRDGQKRAQLDRAVDTIDEQVAS